MNTTKFLDKIESALVDMGAEIKRSLYTDGNLHRLRLTGKKEDSEQGRRHELI